MVEYSLEVVRSAEKVRCVSSRRPNWEKRCWKWSEMWPFLGLMSEIFVSKVGVLADNESLALIDFGRWAISSP